MDQVTANALKRKKELEKELREVTQFLRLHKRFAAANSKRVKRKIVPPREKNPKPGGKPAEFVSLMELILRRRGRPMTRGELADAVEMAGHVIPSADKARYLGTILWRNSKTFENREGKGYWLRGIKVPSGIGDIFDLAIGKPSVGTER